MMPRRAVLVLGSYAAAVACTLFVSSGCQDFGDSAVAGPILGDTSAVFETQVLPIFRSRCAGPNCHRAAPFAAGLDLTDANAFGSLVGVASSGNPALQRVVPGDPDRSLLVAKLLPNPPIGSRMPLVGAPLEPEQIDRIRNWIEALR